MSIFDLEKIYWVNGKIDFFQLIIDGKNQFLEFEAQLKKEGRYSSELIRLQSRMQEMADLKLLPESKCRNITPKKVQEKEYEIKTKSLRLYLFHLEKKGRIVVILTKKKPKEQSRDIAHFRIIKRAFLKSAYVKKRRT